MIQPCYDFAHPRKLGTEQIIRVHPFRYQENATGRKRDGAKGKLEEPERNQFLLVRIVCLGNAAVLDETDAAIEVPDALGNLGSCVQ